MLVKIIAKKTAGIGCIEGEEKVYKNVEYIKDMGTYVELHIHENHQVRVNRENWKIEI